MVNEYVRNYIQKAFSSTQIEPPDKNQANGTYEALLGIFIAHDRGGIEGAKAAWQTLRLIQPELSAIDRAPRLIHADKLKDLPMPKFLPGDYPIYNMGFNVLVGKSGSGKSFLALDIAGRVATQGVVVYIAGEGVSGYSSRWECWKAFHQVSKANLFFYTEALQVMNNMQLWDFFRMTEETCGKKPDLVVIDTMARSAIGLDENSARDMGQFVAAVDHIRAALDCSVLVVHHTGKSGDMRGSTALYGAADSVLAQSLNQGTIRVTNKPDFGGKNKYAASQFDCSYKLVDYTHNGFDGGVLVASEPIAEEEVQEEKFNQHEQAILECLNEHEKASTDSVIKGLPASLIVEKTAIVKSTAYRYLKQLIKAGFVAWQHNLYTITETGKTALADSKK